MTKLSDVQPGQFFRQLGRDGELYLKIAIDPDATYSYNGGPPRKHIAVRTSSFKIATWSQDGDVDVEIVNPEDI